MTDFWTHRDFDGLSNAKTGETEAFRLSDEGLEPVEPVALPQADGAGE